MGSENGLKAMVLAAGVGSRLDPLTRQIPKPLVPIANRPVMEHIINLLKRHGVQEVISNLHHLPECVPQHFADGKNFGLQMTYHHEEKLSGDAGGVRACRDFLGSSTFLVIMGDLITDADITHVVEQHRAKKALATIALQKVQDVSRFGVVALDGDGFITQFQEKPKASEAISDLASTGIYVLEPEIFDHMPVTGELGFGRQLFPSLVASGLPVLGVQVYGYWSDIGTIANYKSSSFDALKGLVDLELVGDSASSNGWIGEGTEIDADSYLEGIVLVGKNSRIEKGARLDGHVIIGDDCVVRAGAIIEDSILWNGVTVGAGATVKGSVVGASVEIAANAILENTEQVESKPIPHRNVVAKRHERAGIIGIGHH